MTVTGENTVFYKYDNANRLTNVVQGTFTTSLFYDDDGRRTKMILPNGINVLYSYDTASRLTNITYQAAATNKIDYSYDDTGNRVAQASLLANYLLPGAVTNSTYNQANQQLTFGSYTILYDADGNVTNIVSGSTTNKLLWSARNQLTNMLGAVTATFAYDGLGRRITRTVTGNTEKYLYDGLDVIMQFDGSANIRGRYFRGLAIDEPWQRVDITPGSGQKTTETNRNYLADALGSIVALADSNKVIQTEYDYEPFGATTTTGAGNKNSYKFTAREEDGTGIYYLRARYYHPGLGRFISEDPIEYASGDINLYSYASNDPINASDPLGLLVEVCFELIPGIDAKRWAAAHIARAKHAYIHVQTPQIDVTIELEGPRPGCRHGNPATRVPDPHRPCIPARVTRPVGEGDYSFEYNILLEFYKFYFDQDSLPDYYNDWEHGNYQNSNGFANYLITSQGGLLGNIPIGAYGVGNPFAPIQPDSPACHCK
jgi:RHS repeat-associated protein